MSTVRKPRGAGSPADKPDRFFYGFRQRTRVGRDGKRQMVTIPLTETDVLHPQEDDHITQNDAHDNDCHYLRDVFRLRIAGQTGTVLLSDCRVDLGLRGVRPVGPDLAVFRGVRSTGGWSTFSVREEGAEPVLIVEVTSPSTRHHDLHTKRSLYARARVPVYVIVDQVSMRRGVRRLRLLAYERGARGYRRRALDARGRVWLEALQIWLGFVGGQVVCWDAAGQEIADYVELAEARRAAEQAREAAEQVRQAEAEARRAAEQARQAAELARQTEAQARQAAEERARLLEEKLRRLQEEE